MLFLGIGLSTGMTPEARKSFQAFEKKAESGDSAAQYRLASILESGWDSINPDSARSLNLLVRSALAGYPPAMNYLGYLYSTGFKFGDKQGLNANIDSALFWLKKSADAGDAKGMSNLAFLLLNFPDSINKISGISSNILTREQRDSLAAHYLKLAAESGQTTAQSMLGDLYRDGRGVQKDTLRAADYYEQALRGGLRDAEPKLYALMASKWLALSQAESYDLGIKYYDGLAPWIGIMLLKQAAVLPEVSDTVIANPTDSLKSSISSEIFRAANAMTLVGKGIGRAYGHKYDHKQSLTWIYKGALAGNPEAKEMVIETEAFFPDAFKEISDSIADFRQQINRLDSIIHSPDSPHTR